MSSDKSNVVRVAAGELPAIEFYKQALVEAGIEAHVLGDSLAASFGTALQGSIELWVHEADASRAETIIQGLDSHHGNSAPRKQAFPHPTSDPKPARPGGHGPHPHYTADPGS